MAGTPAQASRDNKGSALLRHVTAQQWLDLGYVGVQHTPCSLCEPCL